jgi:polyketide synthase Type III
MYIVGIGTATPPNRYTQSEAWAALEKSPQFAALTTRSQLLLRKVLHAENGITRRSLSFDTLDEAFDLTPDTLHARFVRAAPELATRAAEKALQDAHLKPKDIDGLVISTCTGYVCPGLTSYVGERLNIPASAHTLDLVGHGCAAAVPTLRAAEGMLASTSGKRILAICVEVCSAALYLDNDPGVLISACLFADGAGALVLSSDPAPLKNGRTVRLLGTHGMLSHKDREFLRFETRGGMLRNLLSREVPLIVSDHAERILTESETRFGFDRKEVRQWIVHAGGRDILTGVRDALKLTDADLRYSAEVLNEYGNISSPSVIFALERTLQNNPPNGLWWMTTFGAGMACYGAALEVQGPHVV